MANLTAGEVLALIAGSGAAMSALEDSSCVVAEGRPPLVDGLGVLVADADGIPVDAGSPSVTLADLVRQVLA